MIYKRKRIVVALGGNALGNTLPEQMIAVKSTAKALCDLIEEGHQVVVVHGNGPQVGMINNAMTALTHEDQAQPNTPLSVCVAMSQAYIGYDLQNALREELRKRGFMDGHDGFRAPFGIALSWICNIIQVLTLFLMVYVPGYGLNDNAMTNIAGFVAMVVSGAIAIWWADKHKSRDGEPATGKSR